MGSKYLARIPLLFWIILENPMRFGKTAGSCCRGFGGRVYLKCKFQSKMNTIWRWCLAGLTKPLIWPKKIFSSLVVGKSGAKFVSVGANIEWIFMMAWEQEYDELNYWPLKIDSRIPWCVCAILSIHKFLLQRNGLGGRLRNCPCHARYVVVPPQKPYGLVWNFELWVIPGGCVFQRKYIKSFRIL